MSLTVMSKFPIVFGLFFLSALSTMAQAQNSLRFGVADSDGPPIAIIKNNTLSAGLAKDLGLTLAKDQGRRAEFIVLSRARIEWALERGVVDVVCDANPVWFNDAGQLGWTHAIFPQIERFAVPADKPPVRSVADLSGKRISTIRGYSYPQLAPMWAAGKASRDKEDSLELMMRALHENVADVAIVSELAYAAWAKEHPELARQIHLGDFQFTHTPTMCAVSPLSRVSVDALDQSIDELHQQGIFKAILRDYQWQEQ